MNCNEISDHIFSIMTANILTDVQYGEMYQNNTKKSKLYFHAMAVLLLIFSLAISRMIFLLTVIPTIVCGVTI